MSNSDGEWLSISEAVVFTGASASTISERARQGLIERRGTGRRGITYSRSSLQRLCRSFGGLGQVALDHATDDGQARVRVMQ